MKNMIRARLIFLCLMAQVMYFVSCSGDEPDPDPELTLSTEALAFVKEGETKFFHIKSNTSWQVSSSETWCSLTPSTGNAGTIKVEVTASENGTPSTRSARITATAGGLSKEITITQEAAILLTVSQNEYTVDKDGGEITIQVTSSGTYEVDIEGNWITPVEGSSATSPKFKIDEEATLLGRTGRITFSLSGIMKDVVVNQSGVPLTIPADDAGVSSDAMALAQKMKVGWNLGNTLEATNVNNGTYTANETLWGNPLTTQTLIDGVKAAGFNAIRLPCAWSGYIDNQENHRIASGWLLRVKEVVDYCLENDMYVIINIHWDGGWLENNPVYAKQEEINIKQKALWEQIAVYFRGYDEHLLFAGTNEVHFDYGNPTAEHIAVQQSFNQTFVDAVRSTGGKNATRNLVVQAYNTNINHANNFMTMPTDAVANRLMAEVHFYDPYDFTLQDPSTKYLWGADFAGDPNTPTWGQEAWVDEAFGIVKTKFVDNNIPVILGEYGVMFRSSLPEPALSKHIQSRINYLKYVNQAAKRNGLVTFYWDSGYTGTGGSGLFNRATGAQVYSDAINAIITGAD